MKRSRSLSPEREATLVHPSATTPDRPPPPPPRDSSSHRHDFYARYRGRCKLCDKQILPGEEITQAVSDRCYYHTECTERFPEVIAAGLLPDARKTSASGEFDQDCVMCGKAMVRGDPITKVERDGQPETWVHASCFARRWHATKRAKLCHKRRKVAEQQFLLGNAEDDDEEELEIEVSTQGSDGEVAAAADVAETRLSAPAVRRLNFEVPAKSEEQVAIFGEDPPMGIRPTLEQVAIYRFAKNPSSGNLFVEAKAGCGKTTTLLQVYLEQLCGVGKVVVLVFNKSIKEELKAKNIWQACTCHGRGLRICKDVYDVKGVRHDKVKRIMKALYPDKPSNVPGRHMVKHLFRRIAGKCVEELVRIAKAFAVGATTSSLSVVAQLKDLGERYKLQNRIVKSDTLFQQHGLTVATVWHRALKCAKVVLDMSVRLSYGRRYANYPELNELMHSVDFSDMLYFPVHRCWVGKPNGPVLDEPNNLPDRFRARWLLADETQDFNKVQQLFVRLNMEHQGRLIAVGDPQQAIFGFAGADERSVQHMKRDFDCTVLPLTTCFRCPRRHIALANALIPEGQPKMSSPPEAEDGVVVRGATLTGAFMLRHGDAVLCRMNAPLASLYFHLRRNPKCNVDWVGRYEIGDMLLKAARKARKRSKRPCVTAAELAHAMERQLRAKIEKLNGLPDSENVVLMHEDNIRIIYVMLKKLGDEEADSCQLEHLIETEFDKEKGRSDATVKLLTVHKAKGLEWSRVFILQPDWLPFPLTSSRWEREQERNLQYVAYTRSTNGLVFLRQYETPRGESMFSFEPDYLFEPPADDPEIDEALFQPDELHQSFPADLTRCTEEQCRRLLRQAGLSSIRCGRSQLDELCRLHRHDWEVNRVLACRVEDHRTVLQLDDESEGDAGKVRRARKRLAKFVHPDKCANERANEAMARVNDASEALLGFTHAPES